jgi:hypothetical protein
MTPERALQILHVIEQRSGMNRKQKYLPETKEEREEIMEVWRNMPKHTCYYDAVVRIVKGGVENGKRNG